MRQTGLIRPFVVLAVLLFSMFLIWPTVYYFANVKKMTPEERTEYREKHRYMINLGLDLIGGGEALFEVDGPATIKQELTNRRNDIQVVFRQEAISATLTVGETNISVELNEIQDARDANAILEDRYSLVLDWNRSALENTGICRLTVLNEAEVIRDARDQAYTAVLTRLTVRGLEQPSVTRQGDNRLLIRVPGETTITEKAAEGTTGTQTIEVPIFEDLLQPAILNFRMLHADNDTLKIQLIQPEYQEEVLEAGVTQGDMISFKKDPLTDEFDVPLVVGAQVPLGYEFIPGYRSDNDVKYATWFLVSETVEMTGEFLSDAAARFNPSNLSSPNYVDLEFDTTGAAQFRRVTRDNVNKRMAIVLDSICYSAPNIMGEIPDGRAQITGGFTFNEVQELALVLKAGALPAPLRLIYEQTIEPTLGAESIVSGVTALLIGALIVVIFMMIYYGWAGLLADLAVVMNVIVVAGILAMGGATLYLSGIAGLLLTVGMAVDANVLIYERIREELRSGKGWRVSIQNGFDKAFWTIFDANITTLITALVLYHFGVGAVKGFAITMTIGIFVTLYTGLFVTRVLVDFASGEKGVAVGKLSIIPQKTVIDFLKMRHPAYVISAALIVIGLGNVIMQGGFLFSVELAGGVQAEVVLRGDDLASITRDDLVQEMEDAGYEEEIIPTRVKSVVAGENKYMIRSKTLVNDAGLEDVPLTKEKLRDALESAFGSQGFVAQTDVLEIDAITGEVGDEFQWIAIRAVLVAAICILGYIWFRFEFSFGVAAVIALFHDLFITIGMLMLFNRAISLEVVAALLVVMGYSLNDTIVIFDRIRETMRTTLHRNFAQLLNGSISSCLNRTLVTSLTTLITTLILFWYGGEALQSFALTLTIGIIIGTYSSSFVATPVLYEWQTRRASQLHPAIAGGGPATDSPLPVSKQDAKKRRPSKGAMASGRARKLNDEKKK